MLFLLKLTYTIHKIGSVQVFIDAPEFNVLSTIFTEDSWLKILQSIINNFVYKFHTKLLLLLLHTALQILKFVKQSRESLNYKLCSIALALR